MVRRVGGNALSQLMPTLESSITSSDSDAKQGICIATRELIESSSPVDVNQFHDSFVHIIRDTLVDPNPAVREASALVFDVFQDSVGNSAVDEVIPQLLDMLDGSDSENALSALQEIMATKADVIFPILIPSLLTPPIKARALGALAQVAGSALFKRLSTIINSLVDAIIVGDENRSDLVEALSGTLLSVNVDEGCHAVMQQILALMRHEDPKRVAVIYEVLPTFFLESTLDYSVYTHDLMVQFGSTRRTISIIDWKARQGLVRVHFTKRSKLYLANLLAWVDVR
ncbi:unnamed protein product [Ambrosiozyma monospora]|uniref:Unnamed protein product n=1 Tax=Ambrosiozyma monospora TaxID=43982 RepID=A0ACB5U7M2_AMBMO|nr:unnamed protein product [Ambrosiozyma monospora]